MALPKFPATVNSLEDGAVANMASSLQQIKTAQSEFDKKLKGVDTIFEALGVLPVLPNLPDPADIRAQASSVQSLVNTKLQEFDSLAGLTGSCLDGAMGAANSVAGDAFGFVSEALSDFSNVANMPQELMDMSGLYGQARELLGGLGVDKLAASALGKIGCLSDSTMIDDTTAELQKIFTELGMDENGQITDESFQAKMNNDVATKGADNGIDSGFLTSMSGGLNELNIQSDKFAKQAKEASKQATQALKDSIKNNIPKTPTPPSHF